jgi:hypothetical protein
MIHKKGVIVVNGLPIVQAQFNWSVGNQMQSFLKALANKKFLASKCPECGYVYTPPRNKCSKCYKDMGEKDLIELSGQGTLSGWTVAHVELDGKGNWVDLKKSKIIGAVRLDGANSTVFMPLEEVDAKALKVGMKVALEWNSETKGGWKDLKYLKPAKA